MHRSSHQCEHRSKLAEVRPFQSASQAQRSAAEMPLCGEQQTGKADRFRCMHDEQCVEPALVHDSLGAQAGSGRLPAAFGGHHSAATDAPACPRSRSLHCQRRYGGAAQISFAVGPFPRRTCACACGPNGRHLTRTVQFFYVTVIVRVVTVKAVRSMYSACCECCEWAV